MRRFPRSTYIAFAFFSFVAGIATHSLLSPFHPLIPPVTLYQFAIAAGVAIAILFFVRPDFFSTSILVACIGTLLFTLGLWRHGTWVNEYNSLLQSSTLRADVSVINEPRVRGQSLQTRISSQNIKGTILLISAISPPLAYGDVLSLDCTLTVPTARLQHQGIKTVCSFPKSLTIKNHGKGNPVIAMLYKTKNTLIASINHMFPEPSASFAASILFGTQDSAPSELIDQFRKTGTAHIFALSGFNITIIGVFLTALFSYLLIPRMYAFPLASASIVAFIIATGADASVVRAGIMGFLVLLAKNIGRIARPAILLGAAAAVMLFLNPSLLRFDLGFQLSFCATIGLMLFSNDFERIFKFIPPILGLRAAASATASAMLATTPILVYTVGNFSPIGLVVNILVVPLIPLVMGLVALAAVLGIIFEPLGSVITWLSLIPITYILKTISFFAKLSL